MNQAYCPYCMTPVKPGEPCPKCGLTEGSYHSQPHHLPPGTMLADRYMLGRVLGEGGFGITYIGCDTRLELRVAVKEYYPGNHVTRNSEVSAAVTCFDGVAGRGFEKGRERFIREARTMAKMDKTPQIVAVRDFFQENDTAYIVMEYVDGTTFKELVTQRGGGMSAGELLPMLQPLFGALDTMHRQGLIHRDISPDNLMLENGMVRLLDFGCARESEKGNETMTIVLKQGYSPVEQYQHKGQGPWTDVYSLAATMYYCLTGKTPPQALDRICDDELVPPRKLGADLTREQELALLYGMGLQPTRRFRSVQEFYAALYQGAPVPLIPVLPDTREEEAEPEHVAETPPESDTEAVRSREPAVTPAEEQEAPGPAKVQEAEPEPSGPESEASQPAGTDEPGPQAAVRPNRKKGFLIGGIAAAAALILALVLIVPRLAGSAGSDGPAAASGDPAASVEPLPGELFDGAATASNSREFLELMADGSVSAITLPVNGRVTIGDAQTEITKPVRVSPGASLTVSGSLTVSSTVNVMKDAWLDVGADFVLTESGALYIEQEGGAALCTKTGGRSAEIAGTVLLKGGTRCDGDADITGTVQITETGGASFYGKTDVTGTVQVAEGGGADFNGELDVSGAVLSEGWLEITSEDVTITGTVQIAEGEDSGVHFYGFTTVSGPGRLEVNGNGYSDWVFRTVDGGSVTVGSAGHMNFNVLWLEKATDLNAASDRIGLDQARYIVADEDVFDNAAHVSSFREFEQAINDRLVPAIVIDSGFGMEYGMAIGKPVLIREGVELRAEDNSKTPGFSAVIVNYGSVTGFMNLDGQCVYLNYGTTDVSTWVNGGENYLLNMGELNLQSGQYVNATVVNLGRMRHENYGAEDTNFLDLVDTMVENLGEITLCSGNRMTVCGGGYFENRGEVILEENAWLENRADFNCGGKLRVRGALENYGGLLEIPDPSALSMEGGRVEGGIVQTYGDGSALERDENITSQLLVVRDEPDGAVEVSGADELMAALDEGGLTAIRVTGDITVDGDLSLGKDLIIDGGAHLHAANLTVAGKTLYVHGELETDSLTVLGGGQLQLHGDGTLSAGGLTMEDSDGAIWGILTAGTLRLNNSRLIDWGMLRLDELTVDGGSYFNYAGWLDSGRNVSIAVNQGTFAGQRWLDMNGGEITVEEGGAMHLSGGAMLGGDVAVTNKGEFAMYNSNYSIGAILINFGRTDIVAWEWQDVQLHGLLVNRAGGYLRLGGSPNINHRLDNEGDLEISYGVLQINGELNNTGTAYTYNRDAGWQGNWKGRALEYR